MSAVLLTLGRFPKGLDVARSFHAHGWRVIVADPFRSHLSAVSRAVAKNYCVPAPADAPDAYLEALEAIVKNEQIDLIVPVSEEIMHVALLRERVAPHVRIFSMDAQAVHRLHDKWEFILAATRQGLTVPSTRLADDPEAQAIAQADDFVFKKRHSCGGGGTSLHARGDYFPPDRDAIVQARVRGEEVCSCALADEGRVRANVIYRASVSSGTVAVGFERIDDGAIEDWIARFVAAERWSGFISFDFIRDDSGTPYALECNPRLTSGIHFFETIDIAPAVLDKNVSVRLRSTQRLQQFWACLQETQRAVFHPADFRRKLNHLFTTPDVTWSGNDPLPLLTMPWTAREILSHASRARVPLSVASTRDLALKDRT